MEFSFSGFFLVSRTVEGVFLVEIGTKLAEKFLENFHIFLEFFKSAANFLFEF